MTTETSQTQSRAEVLRAATSAAHHGLDSSIMAADPFSDVANYGRFLKVQHAFHRDVAPLYARTDLGALIAGLPGLSRLEAVAEDAADLQIGLSDPEPPASEGLALPEALGWLYVVEGSNLGAAFLLKAAKKMGLSENHGARHLAEAPEGRAAHWRAFKDGLNSAPLSPADEARVVAGAEAAFLRVRALVGVHMA